MMIELSEAQIFFIEKKLTNLGLEYTPLKTEYLDHICCMVEEEMNNGLTFSQASQTIFESIRKDELKRLQKQTILFTNQKSRRMKNAIFCFTLSLFLSTGFFIFTKKEKSLSGIQPPSPEEMTTFDITKSNESSKICNHHFPIKEIDEVYTPSLQDPPDINPIKGEYHVSSKFGMRYHPIYKTKKFHRGIDFKASIGTPVLATANGKVTKADYKTTGYGHHIIIQHDEQFKTVYAQLDEIKVEVGQEIKKGTVIGTVGNSGASTGPHLHYEVIKEGKRVDPIAYCNP